MIITTGHVKAIARQFSNETDVSYSRALEMTSKALGYKNWNGLKASFETAIATPEVITPQISDGQKMRRKTVFSIHKGQDVHQTLMDIFYHKDLIPFIQDMSDLGAINLNNQYQTKDIVLFLLTLRQGKDGNVTWPHGNMTWPRFEDIIRKIFPHKIPRIAQDLIDFDRCSFVDDDIIFFNPVEVNETALVFSVLGLSKDKVFSTLGPSNDKSQFSSHWSVIMNKYFASHCLFKPKNEFEKVLSATYNTVQSDRKAHLDKMKDFVRHHIPRNLPKEEWTWAVDFSSPFMEGLPIEKMISVSSISIKAIMAQLIVETIGQQGFVYVEKGALVCIARNRIRDTHFYVSVIKVDDGSLLKNAEALSDFLQSDAENSHSIEFSYFLQRRDLNGVLENYYRRFWTYTGSLKIITGSSDYGYISQESP